ncbi:MAG TPA: c-type cytochrome domain-containing protein, partial [Candidatus Babeliaceae bacterium]|nr:c-type cytochrome domain-containing protein [Candidatus Babeliaceae bacterium]
MATWRHKKILLLLVLLVIIAASAFVLSSHNETIDFNTQVKPILNKNCITCHGGVRRQGNLSFLFRADALKKAKSGKYAIIPGDAGHSEMIRRIKLSD